MENVTIVGSESGALVLATETGERFTLPIDEVLRSEIRRATSTSTPAARLAASPRDIQAQIRAGLTAEEVSELLNVPIEDVARFEGPVIAEREHIVNQALSVPVLIGSEVEPDAQPTFGVAVRDKLAEVHASNERWASWKDETGWIVKLEFTANDVDHDARWSFDPRRSALAPLNSDATQLSRQGSLPEGLIPRLRAVESAAPSPYKDDSRFDTGAFGPRAVPDDAARADSEIATEDAETDQTPLPARASTAVQQAATRQATDVPAMGEDTADLLDALRRRRGQREAPPAAEDESEQESDGDSELIALFQDLEDDVDENADDSNQSQTPPESERGSSSRRRRRETLPSWDDIVFGARTDD